MAVSADVSIESEVIRLFDACDKTLGPLTALVNNAGVLRRNGGWRKLTLRAYIASCDERLWVVHLRARSSTSHVDEAWRVRRSDRECVFGASRLGGAGEYVDYAASKGALDTLTIGLANEVADEGVRVNSVRAGFIFTDFMQAEESRGALSV